MLTAAVRLRMEAIIVGVDAEGCPLRGTGSLLHTTAGFLHSTFRIRANH